MNNFTQNIRFKNSEIHKEEVYRFIRNLQIKEDVEYQCIIKPYKKSKTAEQRGYYFGVIIPITIVWQGFTGKGKAEKAYDIKDCADQFLKENCCLPIEVEINGEFYEIRKSIAKMKVNEMSEYIDACVTFLGVHGQHVPLPEYKDR